MRSGHGIESVQVRASPAAVGFSRPDPFGDRGEGLVSAAVMTASKRVAAESGTEDHGLVSPVNGPDGRHPGVSAVGALTRAWAHSLWRGGDALDSTFEVCGGAAAVMPCFNRAEVHT